MASCGYSPVMVKTTRQLLMRSKLRNTVVVCSSKRPLCVSAIADGPYKPKTGDMVNVKLSCKTEDGEVLHAADDDSLLTFEVGAGNFMGNPLFKGVDEVVQGLKIGESKSFKSMPMEKDEDLIFSVPIDHEEVQRLRRDEGDGFAVGNYVILSNGGPAKILEISDDAVVLDVNNPLVDQWLTFEVELVSVDEESS